ncbi:hypothetical protein M011DRAFT_405857 [Sporormia fimetaria CBS 119925]|uniref:DUF974-domain-containing protein n=1 Tax=Sporormia fimetaria CBS 119925 TaxID=1340428 RepID=A0A6A6V567_9PLEO|nr:hypothetical protein M011DRAFT_405857 [Sporormia fimetaria CBS 119925]
MAHQRNPSHGEGLPKTPQSVSLKVLRLSRPRLAHQYPLPSAASLGISPTAALAYPSPNPSTESFILSPVLNLPETFGSAYVGETFSCTLCANNELDPQDKTRSISNVKVAAEMQTPSTPGGASLELESMQNGSYPAPRESVQNMLRFELKEEGNHVLAVTVTYTENTMVAGAGTMTPSGGRVRTFRKLYQFVAQQLLSVRTKTGVVGKESEEAQKVLLEAQLENVGEAAVGLESVNVTPTKPFTSRSLNWDMPSPGASALNAPMLNPGDVMQVAFLLEEQADTEAADENEVPNSKRVLGQLTIQWRSALGDRGSLSTGWLTYRR